MPCLNRDRSYRKPGSVASEYNTWTTQGVLEYVGLIVALSPSSEPSQSYPFSHIVIPRHIWGEHIHHGYYPNGSFEGIDFKSAKVEMIERLLQFGGFITRDDDDIQDGGKEPGFPTKSGLRILDVGCGIGGSSRFFCRRFPNSQVVGVTLSKEQQRRSVEINEAAGLSEQIDVIVADALDLPFEDDSFDLVWSCESGGHMPDKQRFVAEMSRVLAPGSCTWCSLFC